MSELTPLSRMLSDSFTRAAALQRPRVILMVGWQRNCGQLFRALDARLPPHSQLWILSEKSKEWRKNELAVEGLTLEGSGFDPRRSFGAAGKRLTSRATASELVNMTLHHVVGYTTDEEALRRLLSSVEEADAAIVQVLELP